MNILEHTRKRRLLGKALVCGFVLAALCSFFPFAAACGQLPRDVVRLHVVANSNGAEDQAVKLLVRDAVLEEAARWYQGAGSMEEASSRLCTHLQSIAGAARQVLGEQGVGYSATAQMTEMYFPTRDYGDFRLPAGRYRTLRVTLGEGAGKNWWCVVFPSLCLPAATQEEALLTLPEGERQVVEGGQDVQVKLKAVELWESLREWLRG
ncbi:MAG TPA: stage II sporulation protein R [Candidatus Acutalibacter ornithocaccae]|uniref:Stage II sporulation protein R n=1 Tax=Candidatus Acutalibacter ornithocaccae TaxID=2838416 RepID=A0A9D2RZ86_9FIRM|nr:stage II sporulation protein R [Candidatus Acutalibacter ornithocaccae]